jgi:hypothetical protein
MGEYSVDQPVEAWGLELEDADVGAGDWPSFAGVTCWYLNFNLS